MNNDRFAVTYHIHDHDEAHALARARQICLEQTVEVDEELVPAGFIRDHILGQITAWTAVTASTFAATVSYALNSTAAEMTQFLNVVLGNTSLKPGIQAVQLHLPTPQSYLPGPRFGLAGLRQLVGVPAKPLLATALKPMGKTVSELADSAYRFAVGGADFIKDDHGLTNQDFCPFESRVTACAAAVARANQHTGKQSLYVANVTAPAADILRRAYFAKQVGAGGLLIAPGLAGFDALRMLATENGLNLPLFVHPALLGSFAIDPHSGFSQGLIFGQLPRAAGADATIYPNYGGRFSFSKVACQDIASACRRPWGQYAPILPMPAGGITLANVSDMLATYGEDFIFLIGGALYAQSPDLTANVQHFLTLIGR